jgi:hypothetical protein
MTESTTLALTALPNGFDGANLRVTVVLTPSISTSDNTPVPIKGTPFDGWTDKIKQSPPSWTVSFTQGGNTMRVNPIKPPSPPEWKPDLWVAIFGGKREAKNRRGNAGLSNSWRLSHNISDLHDRHRTLRLAHAHRALSAKIARNITDRAVIQDLGDLHNSYSDDVECLTAPVLYIFPTLQGDDDDVVAQIDQRKGALEARNKIDGLPAAFGDQKAAIQKRIDHAFNILETQEGTRLRAPALYCVYRHSVASLLSPGTTLAQVTEQGNPNHPLYQLYQSFTDAAKPLVPATCAAAQDPVSAYEHYVLMLLFHRRQPDPKVCTIETPDFHQLLGMVNHYPAMLRPLGLAFDLTLKAPPMLADGPCLIQVDNPFTDKIFGDVAKNSASYQTRCQLISAEKVFCAAARDKNAVDRGYLTLEAAAADGGSVYNFSQEDADGSSLKFTDQAHNAARASEYSSAAPTSMTITLAAKSFRNADNLIVPTPSSAAHPTDAPPSARTVGLSLFHEDRLATLENVIQNAPPAATASGTPKPPTDPLCAEDLMLGIRVDIKHGTKPWRSLCNRKSKYTVHYIDDPSAQPIVWSPTKETKEKDVVSAADEGFVTLGATQTDLDDDTTQTQIHQSLFTWTGWSLSVPKPNGFESFNKQESVNEKKCDADVESARRLKIDTCFELPSDSKLPALRFNDTYQVRCRVVDLAGNSVPCVDADTPHALPLNPTFGRHEPIRAPQIVLTEPIDRERSTGENIDHMVARDGESPASRILVPPRESLRLAELHNLITIRNPLPESAFSGQNLMPDGSFPSVQCAQKEGWYKGVIDADATHNQDAIFLNRTRAFIAKNPFYPDPLAHYIRVKPFLVSDDPTSARPLDDPFYIEIDPHDDWPNYFATIVDLKTDFDGTTPRVDFDNDARPPQIVVNLPRGYTVVLQISSAAYNIDDPKPHRTNASKSVALYNFHKAALEAIEHPIEFARQVRDFIGGAEYAEKVKNRHGRLKNMLFQQDPKVTVLNVLDDPNSYVDGDLPQMTPPRTMTFVHATRRPLGPPDFASKGSKGDLAVLRDRGQSKAAIHAGISAHWMSTSKITCNAEWCDMVDEVTKAGPARPEQPTQNVAFAITAADMEHSPPDFDGKIYQRTLKGGMFHAFPDTRAHDVTYTLSASTAFRGYFRPPTKPKATNPPAPPPDESGYNLPRVDEKNTVVRKICVLSSVRPPAPSLAYVVPAFLWRDTYDKSTRTWFSGRDVVLRFYLQRPFLISGDLESIGVVMATPSQNADEQMQPLVSRWGSDPTRPITVPISSSALTAKNLCQPDDPPQTCQLAEGGIADVKPCAVHYAKDRKLWFSDIPINTLGSLTPFVRLALVRWQPQALRPDDPTNPPPVPVDPNIDCRISPVVFADFMQLSPNRWVSVHRRHDSEFVITVSGVFAPPEKPASSSTPRPTFALCLYSRWYATGKDTGWRQIDHNTTFTYTPTPSDANGPVDPDSCISSWTAALKLTPSATKRKYRVLLQENEWFVNSEIPRVSYSQFVDLP